MKKYIITGIGSGDSGVGRLMNKLVPEKKEQGYSLIYRRTTNPIKSHLKRFNLFAVTIELLRRIFDYLYFSYKCKSIKNSEILFVHPQTAGYEILFNLIEYNYVQIYVMDNSFFCIRSYNTHPITHQECLKCIETTMPDEECQAFPVRYKKIRNIEYLNKLKDYSSRVEFLAQNHKQAELLKLHFGENSKITIIGLDTGELDSVPPLSDMKPYCEYDIVFHGAPIIAKGVRYLVDLAVALPQFHFLIPAKEKDVLNETNLNYLPHNIKCENITWETGLKNAVISAKLVINPSIWSAPIEGALLKSAAYNINVATVKSQYGYEAEFLGISNHLRLSRDISIAAVEIKTFFEECG